MVTLIRLNIPRERRSYIHPRSLSPTDILYMKKKSEHSLPSNIVSSSDHRPGERDKSDRSDKKQSSEDEGSTDSGDRVSRLAKRATTDTAYSSSVVVNRDSSSSSSKWNWKESPERMMSGRSKYYVDRSHNGYRHHRHHDSDTKSNHKSARRNRGGSHQHWTQQKRRSSSGSDSGSYERPLRHYSPPETYTCPDVEAVDETQAARTFYLSIDIETSGPSMVHNFMPCFGAAFIDVEQCKVLEQRLFWIAQPEGSEWDAETVRSFWNTSENQTWYHEVLDRQESSTLPSLSETMGDFVDWVQNHLYSKYAEPHRSHNNVVQLISDNPSYDLGWLSYYLALGTDGRVPHVQYLLNNRFNGRPIDTRSFCDGVRHKLHGPSFTRSDRYRQPRTVTQALRVSQWKKHILGEMGVRYDHNPKHDAVVIGINAAVVACAVADQLRTKPAVTPCLATYDGRISTNNSFHAIEKTSDFVSGSSASSSPSESLPSPSPVGASETGSTDGRFFPKPLNPSSATYVHQHRHAPAQQQQQLFSQAYAHEALLQQSRINQQFRAEKPNSTQSWRSPQHVTTMPIGQIVSNSGVSAAVGPFSLQK